MAWLTGHQRCPPALTFSDRQWTWAKKRSMWPASWSSGKTAFFLQVSFSFDERKVWDRRMHPVQFRLCLVVSIHPPMAAKEISKGLRPPLFRVPITLQMKSHPKPSLRLRTSLLSTSGAHVLLFPIPLPGPSYAVLSRPLSPGFESHLLCLPGPWSDFRVKRRCLLCEALL